MNSLANRISIHPHVYQHQAEVTKLDTAITKSREGSNYVR